jgi:hypothetical protein
MTYLIPLIPAEAGTQALAGSNICNICFEHARSAERSWVPASAGMSGCGGTAL